MGWTVIFVGIGLMMTGAEDTKMPDKFGAAIIVGGVLHIAVSWFVHMHRMGTLERGEPLTKSTSAAWTLVLTALLVVSVCIELYYGVRYPYLKRSKVVEIGEDL